MHRMYACSSSPAMRRAAHRARAQVALSDIRSMRARPAAGAMFPPIGFDGERAQVSLPAHGGALASAGQQTSRPSESAGERTRPRCRCHLESVLRAWRGDVDAAN